VHAALPSGTNMAAVKQQKHLSLSVSIEMKNFKLLLEFDTLKVILLLVQELFS